MTPVFITVDTELMWRHYAAGLGVDDICARSIDPAGVGIGYQLAKLQEHRLKAVFFVDPMPAKVFGIAVFARLVDRILSAGQEVQLHLHPNWQGASANCRSSADPFELTAYSRVVQEAMIADARALLIAAGAPHPIAFRAGSYAANDDTINALAALGFVYDASHNGSHAPWPSAIGLPAATIAPVRHRGIVVVPVTLIHDHADQLRHFQICALSADEMRAALDHALAAHHAAVNIVSHGFELATRCGTQVNRVHRTRFDALCAMLDERRSVLPTFHFGDRPLLRLGQPDLPLGPDLLRTGRRHVEQLWSNLVEESPVRG